MYDRYGSADIAWLERVALLLGIKPIETDIPLVAPETPQIEGGSDAAEKC
jgi:hypothetical protein